MTAPTERYILALDQGTTSSRSMLFDHDGRVVATAQREFTQHFPRSGWVEHDAEEIWATQAATIAEVLARARSSVAELAAVGITNQRETTVLWDRRSGEPVAPAIVWQDRRTADLCARLKAEGHEPEVARRTGLLLDPYFSGTKLAWLLNSDVGLRRRAEHGELAFGTIDSWLAWKISGGRQHVTDATNASRTLLLNLRTGEWDEEMLDLLGIPQAVLPGIVPSMIRDGQVTALLAGRELPLAGIAGDQHAALFGQACFDPGMAKNTYGTGCFMLMNTGTEPLPSANRLLTTMAWDAGGRQYALEGAVFIGGAVVQWLRDGLGFIEQSPDVEALAASVPDAGGVYLVPAFTGLGSPHWDAYARGAMLGGTHRTRRARVDCLPERGGAGRHGARRGPTPARAAGGRRRHGERPDDAVPGRPARRARRATRGHRDHGSWRRVSRRSGRRLLGLDAGSREKLARGAPLRARHHARGSR